MARTWLGGGGLSFRTGAENGDRRSDEARGDLGIDKKIRHDRKIIEIRSFEQPDWLVARSRAGGGARRHAMGAARERGFGWNRKTFFIRARVSFYLQVLFYLIAWRENASHPVPTYNLTIQ